MGKNTTPTSSLASGEGFALPSYDQCVPNGSSPVLADGDGEVVIDENERIALQEAEDERLAREMLQKEEDEVRRSGEWEGRGRKWERRERKVGEGSGKGREGREWEMEVRREGGRVWEGRKKEGWEWLGRIDVVSVDIYFLFFL